MTSPTTAPGLKPQASHRHAGWHLGRLLGERIRWSLSWQPGWLAAAPFEVPGPGDFVPAAYLFAYVYGRMLFSAMQDWLSGTRGANGLIPFPWPGTQLKDYARPSLDLLTLLTLIWILVPVFTFTRSRLTEKDYPPNVSSTFSIASILGWTTVAALILMWIRFLTWKGVTPQAAYSFMTPTQALTEYFQEYFPSLLITSIAIVLVVWGWSGRWWLPFNAFAGRYFWTVAAIEFSMRSSSGRQGTRTMAMFWPVRHSNIGVSSPGGMALYGLPLGWRTLPE